MKNIILGIFILLFTFSTVLWGNSISDVVNSSESVKTVEVSLDSFSTFGIILMVGFSSLLGAYFLKDEFSKEF